MYAKPCRSEPARDGAREDAKKHREQARSYSESFNA